MVVRRPGKVSVGMAVSTSNVSDACTASLTVPTFMMEGEQERETLHVASSCVISPECYLC